MQPQRRVAAVGAVIGLLAGCASLLATGTAGAAGGGAGAPDVPTSNTGGTPSGSNVLCTVTAPAAGGTETCSGVTVTVGATTDGLQIVFSTSAGPACAVAPALSISFVDPVTNQAAGTLSPAASVSYANSSIGAGQTVLVYDPASGGWVLPPSGSVSSASTSAGVVKATLSGNASIVVETSTCGAAIPGATVAVTGKPFLGEGLVALSLVLAGVVALALVLRRRPVRSTST